MAGRYSAAIGHADDPRRAGTRRRNAALADNRPRNGAIARLVRWLVRHGL